MPFSEAITTPEVSNQITAADFALALANFIDKTSRYAAATRQYMSETNIDDVRSKSFVRWGAYKSQVELSESLDLIDNIITHDNSAIEVQFESDLVPDLRLPSLTGKLVGCEYMRDDKTWRLGFLMLDGTPVTLEDIEPQVFSDAIRSAARQDMP